MTRLTTFEPIQYTKENYENGRLDMNSESMADEYVDESEDKSEEESEKESRRARKHLRTRGLIVPSSGFSTWSHNVQANTSAHTVDEETAGASSIANCFIDQEPQTTDACHGPRVPGLLLTTLLPPRLLKDLFLAELPLELDASHMNAAYTMISVPVPDSINFKARYSSLLHYFKKAQLLPEQKTKPTIFVLTSISNCTVKIITVAEKLKRDLRLGAIECFQYCAMQPRNVSVDHFNKVKRNRKGEPVNRNPTADGVASVATGSVEQASNDNDEEEAFQTMTVAHEDSPMVAASGTPKLRRLPMITIFLALTSAPELRYLFWLDALGTNQLISVNGPMNLTPLVYREARRTPVTDTGVVKPGLWNTILHWN